MARPKKNKIDYFPHDVNTSGKTLYILEQKYGNDGYAFWFKILEILGDTEGHSFCYRNPQEWEFLTAKTHTSEEKATEILETLSKLGAIDPELYQEGIIWSQNFVDRIADVYVKRRQETPKKPVFIDNRTENTQQTGVSGPKTPVSVTETPQSKVKESKVNKTKVNKSKGDSNREKTPPPPPTNNDHRFIPREEIKDYLISQQAWMEQAVLMKGHATIQNIDSRLDEFIENLIERDEIEKTDRDAKIHFINWLKLKNSKENETRTNRRHDKDQQRKQWIANYARDAFAETANP